MTTTKRDLTTQLRSVLDASGIPWWELHGSEPLTECVHNGVRIKWRQHGSGFIVSTCTEDAVGVEDALAVVTNLDSTGGANDAD